MADKTALSYWFRRIEAAGLPVPRTRIVKMPDAAIKAVWGWFDGLDNGDAKPFLDELAREAAEIGYPCFLRTDYTSGKHEWGRTCYLTKPEDIPSHVFAIAEYSETRSMMGELPWDTWAVREFLPTIPLGICPRYGNVPVCREFRAFVHGAKVLCLHQYWPVKALIEGGLKGPVLDDLLPRLDVKPEEEVILLRLAATVGKVLGGSWSVDILETARGWYVADMAEAHKSWHSPGCPHAEKKNA